MGHGFLVYIDESGDEGFRFVEDRAHSSSEWFVLSALVIKTSAARSVIALWRELTDKLESRANPIHFTELNHDQCVALIHKLSISKNCWVVSICVNKRSIDRPHTLSRRGERRLYFYATRLLLERVSWLARSETAFWEPLHPAKLIFSHCRRLSYGRLQVYLTHLQSLGTGTTIDWPYLNCAGLAVKQHRQLLGLRMADAVASGIRRGLELSRYGLCEPRFAVILKSITYKSRLGKFLGYGLKFFPNVPAEEPARDNRYKWIKKYSVL